MKRYYQNMCVALWYNIEKKSFSILKGNFREKSSSRVLIIQLIKYTSIFQQVYNLHYLKW